MSHTSLIKEALFVAARPSPLRTWAGTMVDAAERATHYLHLAAFPCEKCNGPVILGWIGTREDDIAGETEVKETGAACLSCGSRPESLDPLQGRHFRPVEWEWTTEKKPGAMASGGDPLAAELSQDADRP